MISVTFTPIVPAPFNEGIIRLYILNEIRKISTEIKKDFERTVRTWTTKPKFVSKKPKFSGAGQLEFGVFTKDENYARVSEGTKGKPRVATGAGIAVDGKPRALTIIPYIPKSPQGQLDAQSGGYAESPIFFRKYSLNAGKIKARKFDELIYEEWDDKLADRMQQALDAAALSTGYAI